MNVIHTEKSQYRDIVIFEDDEQRCMSFNRHNQSARQSSQSLDDPNQFVFSYTKLMMGALYLNPAPRRILIVGLGGGMLPTALSQILPDAAIDVVEIDPAVVRVARRFFGFDPGQRVRIIEEDGREFVQQAGQSRQRYDLIMLDAFDHEYIPEHLRTQEFLIETKALLTADGVLAANTFSCSHLYHHESTTYEAVFGEFYNLRIEYRNRIILVKLDGLPTLDVIGRNAEPLQDKLRPFGFGRELLLPLFTTQRDWNPRARVLTDRHPTPIWPQAAF